MNGHSQSFISPLNSFEQIHQVEQELLKYQMQKEEYENEYNKIPESYRRSFAQRKRKEFLSEEIDRLARQINEAKLFIRKKKMERDASLK